MCCHPKALLETIVASRLRCFRNRVFFFVKNSLAQLRKNSLARLASITPNISIVKSCTYAFHHGCLALPPYDLSDLPGNKDLCIYLFDRFSMYICISTNIYRYNHVTCVYKSIKCICYMY